MRTQKSLYPLQLVPLEAFLFFSFFMVLGMKPHHARVGAPPLSHASGLHWRILGRGSTLKPRAQLFHFGWE